ncbi:hypothetical protein TNCV_3503921 [Trichonephila clavipes]|uniref:Uncharacterized protein n=1 Tax=Trichonephila clavipes TaxID=2585209 RepID=A0A8X6S5R1_TRICX|nr:hypothetical protein TNCV_3503921 [Trichonephila clavipes]
MDKSALHGCDSTLSTRSGTCYSNAIYDFCIQSLSGVKSLACNRSLSRNVSMYETPESGPRAWRRHRFVLNLASIRSGS